MVLRLDKVGSGYDAVPIVNEVSLEVGDGTAVALVGRNGVGKTTLVRAIVGELPTTAGRIYLDGADVTGLDSVARARRGVGYVPQGRGIFARLTVEENLRMGSLVGGAANGRDVGRAYEWFPILKERRSQRAGTLSGGQQQMLAIGRVLVAKPRMLVLDEPSEGIQPSIVEEIGRMIRSLNRQLGIAVLVVEQNIGLVQQCADHCLVMDKGRIVDSVAPSVLLDPERARAYLAI